MGDIAQFWVLNPHQLLGLFIQSKGLRDIKETKMLRKADGQRKNSTLT